ncbi:DUF58 domain-containing protein [Bacteriovoracaceae bacterium]|nr:DUF58 domain-containing protein [Bacteriovoracaceae bacterium]
MSKETQLKNYLFRNLKLFPLKHFFFNNLKLLDSPLFFKTILIILAFKSLLDYHYLKFFIPFIVIYWYSKLTSQKFAQSFFIKRELTKKSKEGNKEELTYKIKNLTGSVVDSMVIFDTLECSKNKDWNIDHSFYIDSFMPHSINKRTYNMLINNGMGDKEIGPICGYFIDSLGLSQYEFIFSEIKIIRIFPKVMPTHSPKLIRNDRSMSYGSFDSIQKGYSSNFYSTKEYQVGDPVKFINWKLSLKTHKTIVNVFENNTNAKTMAVLVDDDRMHFGFGEFSSFEYCKDLILSLFHTQIKTNNDIGFTSHQRIIGAKNSLNHLFYLEYLITKMSPLVFPKIVSKRRERVLPNELKKLERKIFHYVDLSTNLFVFTGLVPGKNFENYLKLLVSLKKRVARIHLICVYGFKDLFLFADEKERVALLQLSTNVKNYIPHLKKFCNSNGIDLSLIKLDLRTDYKTTINQGFTVESRK